MNRIAKAIKMIDYLALSDVVSLESLSFYLEMSERAVQRLKDDLIEAGYDIRTIKGPGGGYKLERGQRIQSSDFTLKERRQIKQALSLLIQEERKNMGPGFKEAIAKLGSQLNYQYEASIPNYQTVKLNIDYDLYQSHMVSLEQAIENHIKVKIAYQKNRREKRAYLFEPYALIVVNGMWYLTGFDEQNRYLSLKIIRMTEVILTDKRFRYDEDYAKQYGVFESGYRIEPIAASIRISNMDYLSEYIWGEEQKITWLDDYTYRLEVIFPNEKALNKFVLGGGAHMFVESPQKTQDWVVDQAKAILKRYT